jgi:urease accessory protein
LCASHGIADGAEVFFVLIRAVAYKSGPATVPLPFDLVVMDAQARHIRRKLITLQHGDQVLVDFPLTVMLKDRDVLVLEDNRTVEVIAAEEELMEVRARDSSHLTLLAWHIGNRHLDAQIEADRLLLRRDKVIALMLEHQGATVKDVRETFSPEHGAYHGH